ncbi:transcriptional regulator [Exilibacterium tricleocarpae]|uniref:Transcriptional regulator n=1 Tax=Exilibacterium tricleocarpae TaxID=2591008 RepID=A0A545UA91_9GAMM|nr:transcriptional regulator [Exilibacterium tricleocarpae]
MNASSEKILRLLKTRGAMTAQQLAVLLNMTSMGARQHLHHLQNEGLVSTFDRKEKVGRPSRYWQLTTTAQQHFPDRHADLTLALIDNVRELFGEEGLQQLIDKREREAEANYSRELAALPELGARLARLAELRSGEGYMAEVIEQSPGQWLLVENHCPICAAAASCRNFCRSELAIFRRCLRARVERSEYILDGARRCAYLITALPAESA